MQATGTKSMAQCLQTGWLSQLPHEFSGTLSISFSAFPHKSFEPLCLSVLMSTVPGHCTEVLQAVPVGAPVPAAQIYLH